MSFAVWALIIGALLITMVLSGSLLKRLPLSPSMLYLAVGYGLGNAGWALMMPNPQKMPVVLESVAETALLISLFSVGLKLGLPLSNKQWRLPLRLALGSMALTIALIAAVGHYLLSLSLGAAILLGGILAPTDPVLASDVQVDEPDDRDRLRFSLTGEGGLNDGAAFPFVMLGLGLLGLHDLGTTGWRWLAVDVLWAQLVGLAIGSVLGTLIGKLVIYLRTHHRAAVGLDEFLALGLVALAYGASVSTDQRRLISWFGIRGIGSIYYLMFAINHGLPGPQAEQVISLTLTTVAVSIVVHGVSVTPLMMIYARRKQRRRPKAQAEGSRQERR